MIARATAALVGAATLAGCSASSRRPPATPPPASRYVAPAPYGWAPPPTAGAPMPPPYEWGRASYYSDRLAGHRTAAGERYDPAAFTAAHRTLPFGTLVDVARADGRHVTVRINDRGPYAAGRIIDLSRRAAAELGIVRAGVADVVLRVLWLPADARRMAGRM